MGQKPVKPCIGSSAKAADVAGIEQFMGMTTIGDRMYLNQTSPEIEELEVEHSSEPPTDLFINKGAHTEKYLLQRWITVLWYASVIVMWVFWRGKGVQVTCGGMGCYEWAEIK